MSNKNEMTIDWLTLSWRGLPGEEYRVQDSIDAYELANSALETIGILDYALKPAMPKPFYKYAFECNMRGLQVHVSDRMHHQGMLVVFPGKALDRVSDPHAVVGDALRAGWKCTRIDIALDVWFSTLSPRYVYDSWVKENTDSKRTHGFIAGSRGDTFTLGSRKSERYMRVYDKGAQQRVNVPWLRVEMEYKGKMAQEVAFMAQEGAAALARDMMAFLSMPDSSLEHILSSMATDSGRPHVGQIKNQSDRERWFMEQVYPAFRTLAEQDYEAAVKVMRAFGAVIDFEVK